MNAWQQGLGEEDILQVQEALSLLHHHNFFKSCATHITGVMINKTTHTADSELAPLIRKYQAEMATYNQLSAMAEEASRIIHDYQGD